VFIGESCVILYGVPNGLTCSALHKTTTAKVSYFSETHYHTKFQPSVTRCKYCCTHQTTGIGVSTNCLGVKNTVQHTQWLFYITYNKKCYFPRQLACICDADAVFSVMQKLIFLIPLRLTSGFKELILCQLLT